MAEAAAPLPLMIMMMLKWCRWSNESIQIEFELREFSLYYFAGYRPTIRHRHSLANWGTRRPSKRDSVAPSAPSAPLPPPTTGTNYFNKIPVMDHLKDIM